MTEGDSCPQRFRLKSKEPGSITITSGVIGGRCPKCGRPFTAHHKDLWGGNEKKVDCEHCGCAIFFTVNTPITRTIP